MGRRTLLGRAPVAAICALLAAGGLALFIGGSASAAIYVHCPAGDLNAAMNAAPAGATIIVDGTCVGTFSVAPGHNFTLLGPAVLDGALGGTVLTINASTVKLVSITVQHGLPAGISANGVVTLQDSTVSDNFGGNGGGIFNTASLTVVNSRILRNSSGLGAGIFNQGGAFATISGTTIDHNAAQGLGGGIYSGPNSTATVLSSFVTNNAALFGAGIYNDAPGNLTVKGSHVNNNGSRSTSQGGGLMNQSTASITSTELLGNMAISGGGAFNNGNMTLRSSSVVFNTAFTTGGGVLNSGSLTNVGSAISNNTPDNCVGC